VSGADLLSPLLQLLHRQHGRTPYVAQRTGSSLAPEP
jgi:hypothetical protein